MLHEGHYRAIYYLAQPNHGGLTIAQIAAEIGVSDRVIYDWKKNPLFQKELKNTIVRHTQDDLPDMVKAMVDEVKKNGNAAMARLVMQMHEMIPKDTAVDDPGTPSSIESMKKRIEEYRKRNE